LFARRGRGIFFAPFAGLTVEYVDLVPKQTVSRMLAVAICFLSVLPSALFAPFRDQCTKGWLLAELIAA